MKRNCGLVLLVVGCVVSACATSTPGTVDPLEVRVIEAVLAPDQHLELPRTLDGCEHRGMVRVTAPEGSLDPPFLGVPPELLDQLKAQAARKGANTIVVLPGKRVLGTTFRGSAFTCPPQ